MTARVEATGPPDAARAILGKVPVGELKDVRVLVWPLKQDDLREFSATSLDFGVTEQ